MTPEQTLVLRQLLLDRTVASLGTLHRGEPFVSMVPFALLPGGSGFVVCVSQLSAHTRDMVEDPRVSLMVVAAESPGTPPQALARVTVQAHAERWPASDPRHSSAREAYLARFPQAVDLLQLPDFSIFVIRPLSIRFIAGFAQALTLTPEALATALDAG